MGTAMDTDTDELNSEDLRLRRRVWWAIYAFALVEVVLIAWFVFSLSPD